MKFLGRKWYGIVVYGWYEGGKLYFVNKIEIINVYSEYGKRINIGLHKTYE